jgi:hypothetical protein
MLPSLAGWFLDIAQLSALLVTVQSHMLLDDHTV